MTETRRPILIDCDPGVDDAIALLLAMGSPELDIRAITTVAGNVPLANTTENAQRILALAGREDIPVHAGCAGPLLGPVFRGKYSGSGGLGGSLLPAPTVPVAEGHAVDAITRELLAAAAADAPIELVITGPMTNVATALARDPSITRGIKRITCMAGAFSQGGNRTPTAEFNVLADPHAAKIVSQCGVHVVYASIDVTFQALATPARVAALRAMTGRVVPLAAELITFYDRNDPDRYGEPGGPLHDPVTIGWLLWPELFTARECNVEIETAPGLCYGQTVADLYGVTDRPKNATVLRTLDAERFFQRVWARIDGLK